MHMSVLDRRAFLASCGAAAVLKGVLKAQPASKLTIDAYSRHLQWLRSADEVAEATAEMGYQGLDITVRPFPGHVQPERVEQDLPPFVGTIRKHGLKVNCLALTNILDAAAPHLEQCLKTASELGIQNYWGLGTYRFDARKTIPEQLEAIKPRLARVAALNAKYRMTGLYHTYSGNAFGAGMWDILGVLRDFDPAQIGLHYDVGHMTNAGGNGTWIPALRAAARYVRGVSVKDSILERNPDGTMRVRYTPLGEGSVQLAPFAAILKEIQFSGPIEIQAEYPNGGAEDAHEKITLPRTQVLGAMKKDLEVLKKALVGAGFAI